MSVVKLAVTAEIEKSILVHELQLGEQLNECIHEERLSDFSLMLAMLTKDVTAHSQFALPVTEQQQDETTNQTLRKEFSLPEESPLALTSLDDISAFNQAQLIQNEHYAQVHLLNVLNPKPLAFRDNNKHVPKQVIENTSLYCQQNHKNCSDGKMASSRLAFKAKEWLKGIDQAILKSSMLNEHSIA